MTEVVHILDRFVPELERYLLIEDIGCFLIAEGLLSNDDYLALVRRTSKKEAVVELLQLVKRKGPDCLQSFLHALQRSCTETSTPHQGHIHLWELFQTSKSGAHPLKKHKSKSLLSLIKWNKNSKSNKELTSPLWISTPHSTAVKSNSSQVSSAALSPLASRKSILALSSNSQPSDEENYRNSIHDSSSSQDSYLAEVPSLSLSPPQPATDNTQDCIIEELQKENEDLKNTLKKKTKDLEKSKMKLKEQSSHIEELKGKNEKYKSKVQTLEAHVVSLGLQLEANEQMTEHDSIIDDLQGQIAMLQSRIHKVMQEKESLKRIVQGSLIPTKGPNSKSRKSRSLGHGVSESLSSINEIDELKSELDKKDEVLHSKLDHIVQICQGMQEPSKLNRKWQSELFQSRHHGNNSSFLLSQT